MAEQQKSSVLEVKETLEEVKTVVPIATEIIEGIGKAIKFIIHCFGCKNKKGTPVLLKHDSVEIEQKRNSVQVRGVCATCGKNVRGFISKAEAAKHGFKPTPTDKRKAESDPAEQPEAKRAEVITAEVSEPAKEDKQ